MNKSKNWEVVTLSMHVCAIALHLNFVSWAHILVWITLTINLIYWIITFAFSPARRELHQVSKGNQLVQSIWRICAAIATMGFLCSITLFSLCIVDYNKSAVLVLIWCLLAMIAMAIAHFMYDQHIYRSVMSRFFCVLVGTFLLLQFSLLDLVRWQYRNYPTFIQTFEFYQLDPGNQILKDHVVLEQMRIFLSPDQFEKYEKEHLRPIRRSNQW
jgi:hypothetical protein